MPKQKRPASSAIMTDKVTELILHDIQTGLLVPGAWLKQIDLEQRYRCGRPEVRRALDRLAAEFVRLMADGTTLELYEANLVFHHHLLSLCGNQELVALVAEIRQRTSAAPVHQWTARVRIEQSTREHDEMIDAVRQADGERLRTVMTRHIRQQDR